MGRVLIMADLRKPVPPVPPVSSLRSALSSSLPKREVATRAFVFSTTDFERVRKLIYQHAGISLSPGNRQADLCRVSRCPGEKRWRRVGAFCQFADHQPHLLLPRAASLSQLCRAFAQTGQSAPDPRLVFGRLDW